MDNSVKDRVLESVDIVDVIGERVALKRRGTGFVGLCPFHDDHDPSLTVTPRKRLFKCWSCGAGGDVIKFVQMIDHVEFREALAKLAKRAGIEMRHSRADDANAALRERMRSVLEWAARHYRQNLASSAGAAAREYAIRRGISAATIDAFEMGVALPGWDELLRAAERARIPLEDLQAAGLTQTSAAGRTFDFFRDRLMLPIHDGQGRVCAFGGRVLGGDDPRKYLNSPDSPVFNKSRVLFGLHKAKDAIARARAAIVVEGYLDVVLLHQAGVTNSVAALGTAMTEGHLSQIGNLADTVYLCFDGDAAGLRAADRAVETAVRQRVDSRVAIFPDGEDPADVIVRGGADAFKSFLQSAIGALEYKWNRVIASTAQAGPRARRDAVETMLRFVAEASSGGGINPLDQGMLVGRLAGIVGLPPEAVYEQLAGLRRRTPRRQLSESATSAEAVRASYDEATAALPAALVACVEELIGIALVAPETFASIEGSLGAAAHHCGIWRRALGVMQRLTDGDGGLTLRGVVDAAEDAELCDLIDRARRRVPAEADFGGMCEAARLRLAAELDGQRAEALRGQVFDRSAAQETRDAAFRALLESTRRQHGVLDLERRSAARGSELSTNLEQKPGDPRPSAA